MIVINKSNGAILRPFYAHIWAFEKELLNNIMWVLPWFREGPEVPVDLVDPALLPHLVSHLHPLVQDHHDLPSNLPLLGHLGFLGVLWVPTMHQYFFSSVTLLNVLYQFCETLLYQPPITMFYFLFVKRLIVLSLSSYTGCSSPYFEEM